MSNPSRPYRVRAKTACEAVGLDRDRFNEDVAAGIYTCAPETSGGKARIFEEVDLLGLFFYAYLRRMDIGPKRAAGIACIVKNKAQQLLNSDREIAGDVVLGFDYAGSISISFGEDVKETLDGTVNGFTGTRSPMILSIRFALKNALDLVKERVDDLTSARGED